jgi:hypothetical protein
MDTECAAEDVVGSPVTGGRAYGDWLSAAVVVFVALAVLGEWLS